MSVSCRVSAGAYALVEAKVEANQLTLMCENQHNYNINKPFPPVCTCGKPVEVKTVALLRSASLFDLIGDAYDKFLEYNRDNGLELDYAQFVIYSAKKDDTILLQQRANESWIADKLEPKNYQQYIYAFEAKFAEELAILREKANSVDVRFGVLVTWS